MTTRERIELLQENRIEAHVTAAVLGLDVEDVVATLSDPEHTPTDPSGGGLEGVTRSGGIPDDEEGADGDWALGSDGTIYAKQNGKWRSLYRLKMSSPNELHLATEEFLLSGAPHIKDSGAENDEPKPEPKFYMTDGDGTYRFSVDPSAGAAMAAWDGEGNAGQNVSWQITSSGYEVTTQRAAPSDADIQPGQVFSYFDATDGAAFYVRKGRTMDGTLVETRSALAEV